MPLKTIRLSKRITKNSVIIASQINPVDYDLIEAQQEVPTVEQAKKICRLLKVRICDVQWK